MKRIFLLLTLLCAVAFANAQSLSFIYAGNTIANGDTITVYGTPHQTIMPGLNVHNNTDSTISNAYATCSNLTTGGVINVEAICFGACLPGNVSPVIAVGPNSTAADLLVVDLAVPSTATAGTTEVFSLTAGNNRTYTNMAQIFIKAIVHTVGINEAEDNVTLTAFPNPAHYKVCMQYALPEGNNGNMVIYNQLGSVVKEIPLSQTEGQVEVNINDLPNGIYTYGVTGKGYVSCMKKLVVK
jgi:hypothetical protein